MDEKIVTRFAPSPTGFMHIGGVRTALFAFLYARKKRGTFILRIEDTDKEREVPGSIEHIQQSLSWLGIRSDYGPDKPGPFGSCIQSERLPLYRTYAEKLIAKGYAYPDPYSKEELEAFRSAAADAHTPFLYRNHRPEVFEAWDGKKPLRLKVPEIKRYKWHDEVRGPLEAGEEMLDDIILIKADGYPTYNFAHIVDDLEMGVTHIMRGDEFISSMPKFLSIYDALDVPYPKFVTLPPILRDDRTKKLGKRDGAKDLLEYRAEGYLSEAMVNFLALIGWNPGTEQELFSLDELINAFTIDNIQKGGAAFNEEKLLWMNREYIQKMDDDTLFSYVLSAFPDETKALPLWSEEKLRKLLPVMRERIHVRSDVAEAAKEGEYDFAFSRPDVPAELVKWKNDATAADAAPRLRRAIELLQGADWSTPASIKDTIWPYAEEVGKGELLWPLRVSLTGKERSPDPFIVAHILGREETILRVENACAKIS